MQKITSTVCGSLQRCMDNFPPLLRFKVPRSKAFAELKNMCSTTPSHSPLGLYVFDPYHFFSDPDLRNDQCPCENMIAYLATVVEFAIHHSVLSLSLHTMSSYINMKMIRPVNCSRSHCISFIIFLISARICNVVNPGKSFHSSSIGSPSIRSDSRY